MQKDQKNYVQNNANIQFGMCWYFLVKLMLFSSEFANPRVILFNDTSAWYHWMHRNQHSFKRGDTAIRVRD